MTVAIVDTTVVIHLFQRYVPALTWYASISQQLGITPITWMEVIHGAGSKTKQVSCKAILSQFDMVYLISTDQDWAMKQMEQYRLGNGKWYINQRLPDSSSCLSPPTAAIHP